MGGTRSNGNGGELGSELCPAPLNAKPLSQVAGLTQSTLETSAPQQAMVAQLGTHKTRSLVWTHFVKLVINGEEKAKCMHCHRLFSGKSKNGTSHLRAHMSWRCPRRFGRVVARQKLLTFNRCRQEVTAVKVVENHSSPVCLDGGEDECLLSRDIGLECGVVEKSMIPEPKLVIECNSDGHEHAPVCLDGGEDVCLLSHDIGLGCGVVEKSMNPEPKAVIECNSDDQEHALVCVDGGSGSGSQCSELVCGSLSNLVIKANYKEDTVRFDFPLTSSVDQLEKEVAKNLKLALNSFKIKYLDEDKEWMLMTMDSHLSYALNLSKSSGSNVIRLVVSDF